LIDLSRTDEHKVTTMLTVWQEQKGQYCWSSIQQMVIDEAIDHCRFMLRAWVSAGIGQFEQLNSFTIASHF